MAKVELHTAEQVALRLQQILGTPNTPGVIGWFPGAQGTRRGNIPCIKPVNTANKYFLVTSQEFKRIEDCASAAVQNGYANAGQVRARLLVSYSEAQDVHMYTITEIIEATNLTRQTVIHAVESGKIDCSWKWGKTSGERVKYFFDQEYFDKAVAYFKNIAARREELKKARIAKTVNADPQQVSLPLAPEGKITVNIKGMQIILDRADAEKLAESIVNQL